MKNYATHYETNMYHLKDTKLHMLATQEKMIGDLKDIENIMANLLSQYPSP
jgi:hypothetical protein